jgi:hypothetical protein
MLNSSVAATHVVGQNPRNQTPKKSGPHSHERMPEHVPSQQQSRHSKLLRGLGRARARCQAAPPEVSTALTALRIRLCTACARPLSQVAVRRYDNRQTDSTKSQRAGLVVKIDWQIT